MRRNWAFPGWLVPVLLGPAIAFAEQGTSGLHFLTLRPASRAEALGGALTASGNDLSSLAINPATLSQMKYPEAMFTQALLFEDIKFSYAAYAQPTKWGMPAFEYMNLSYGEFDRVERDGSVTGTQSPSDSYFGFGWSTKRYKRSSTGDYFEHRTGLFKNLDAGFNIRYFKSDLGAASASGISVNFGTLWRTPFKGLALGLALNNLGSSVKHANDSFDQPSRFRLGTSYTTHEFLALSSKARFSVDGILPRDGGVTMGLGAELFFTKLLSLQVGYDGTDSIDNRIRFGLGMGMDAISLNYSAAPMGELGVTHRITARMRFGRGIWNIMSILSGEQAVQENLKMAREYKDRGDHAKATIYAHRVLKKESEHPGRARDHSSHRAG